MAERIGELAVDFWHTHIQTLSPEDETKEKARFMRRVLETLAQGFTKKSFDTMLAKEFNDDAFKATILKFLRQRPEKLKHIPESIPNETGHGRMQMIQTFVEEYFRSEMQTNERELFRADISQMVNKNLRHRLPLHVLHLPDVRLTDMYAIMNHLDTEIQNLFLNDFRRYMGKMDEIEKWVEDKTGFAILSHRWSDDELTLQDIEKLSSSTALGINRYITEVKSKAWQRSSVVIETIARFSADTQPAEGENRLEELQKLRPHIKNCTGLIKLINFCELSRRLGCELAWVDTGCIDKTSSAELEESVRSMFRWYRTSKICIVHLSRSTYVSDLYRDPWFTRGWTLQELLAPKKLKFYNSHWKAVTEQPSDKTVNQERTPLMETISRITGVSVTELIEFNPGMQNIRERLSWAAKRNTTRIEDMAYCLIGIFDISLPIAYGEGKIAFFRFQEEMIRRTGDQGLFLWNGKASPYNSVLAASPDNFSMLEYELKRYTTKGRSPSFLTNFGLRISLPIHDVSPTIQPRKDGKLSFVFDIGTRKEPMRSGSRDDYNIARLPATMTAARENEPTSQARRTGKWTYVAEPIDLGGDKTLEGQAVTFKIAVLASSPTASLAVLLIRYEGDGSRYRRVPGSPVFMGDWSSDFLTEITIA